VLTKLQTVQNAAVRVVTGTRKFDHITPVLHQLDWLPVRQRITTFKYSYDHLQVPSWSGWRRPTWLTCASPFHRSSTSGSCGRLTAGHSSCRAPGRRDFAVSGPATWNSVPVELRTASLSSQTFAKTTQKSFIRLLAPLKTFV